MNCEHIGDTYFYKNPNGKGFACITRGGWRVEFLDHSLWDCTTKTLEDAKTRVKEVYEYERLHALQKELAK